jgi:trehalose-phosphatase
VEGVPDFWQRLREAPHAFLGLDYDGTLAPFRVDPMTAVPLPGVPGILRDLSARPDTTVAVISGRPVGEVVRLLGDLPVVVVGGHGMEQRDSDGAIRAHEPDALQMRGLHAAQRQAAESMGGGRLEVKKASCAVHTRGLAREEAEAVEERVASGWETLAPSHRLECLRFDGGVEVRCLGRDKGSSLEELLTGPDALAVYVGDDVTDEDAFRRIAGQGIGIRVGGSLEQSAATGRLADCESVREFLDAWRSLPL